MNGLLLQQGAVFSVPRLTDPAWRIRSVGDLDGDGRADLFWQHEGNGAIAVWLMDGLRVVTGTVLDPSSVADPLWRIVGTADFDGDRRRDLVWHHQGDGRIAIWLMNGTSLAQGLLTSPAQVPDTAWKIRAVGDLNADGFPDFLWQHTGNGSLAVWHMRGLTLLESRLLSPAQVLDLSWHIVGPR
jgi:hypothetical protein